MTKQEINEVIRLLDFYIESLFVNEESNSDFVFIGPSYDDYSDSHYRVESGK